MKRKPFLPLTAVQEVATPANKYTVVRQIISDVKVNGASDSAFVVKNSAGVESTFEAAELELATA